MRALILSLFLALAPLAAAAQQDEIAGVIQNQLDAFNDRDVETAFTFASPMIKGLFGTPQNFGMMVERGYPMVWTNSDTRFLDLTERGSEMVQRVLIRDANGVAHVLEYDMINTDQGWQINGVRIVPAPEVGA